MLYFALASTASESVAYWPSGTDVCPCIDPWTNGHVELNGHEPAAVTAGCDLVRSEDGLCFGAAYGSGGCAAYDETASPECGVRVTSKPEWCSMMWCYVDPADCARSSGRGVYFANATWRRPDNSTTPLSYSYQTCGSVDYFTHGQESYAAQLRAVAAANPGGKLRIGFPGDDPSHYTIVTTARPYEGIGGTNRSGSAPVFFDNMMLRLGVPWGEVVTSDASRAYSPTSSFTACTHDVAIGHVDMCWGNFWGTATRRKLASFSSPFYRDNFHVVVWISAKPPTWEETFKQPFKPFSLELWLLIFSILGFVGVLATREAAAAAKHSPPTWAEALERAPSAIFRGWHGLNTGEIKGVDVKTSGGWLSQYAVGLTKTVVLAGYTSVVVSTLIKQGTTEVTSFEGAIRNGYLFCCDNTMIPGVSAQYPTVAPLLVPTPLDDVIDAMDEGLCDAAITHGDQWFGERLWGERHHCETKARLVETVTALGNSIPVRDDLQAAMSWAIRTAVEAGEYAPLKAIARTNYTGNLCQEVDLTTAKVQLGVRDLGGPLLFLLIVSAVSLLITRVGQVVEHETRKAKAAIDVDGDGNVSTGELISSSLRLKGRVEARRRTTKTDSGAASPTTPGSDESPTQEEGQRDLAEELKATAVHSQSAV